MRPGAWMSVLVEVGWALEAAWGLLEVFVDQVMEGRRR